MAPTKKEHPRNELISFRVPDYQKRLVRAHAKQHRQTFGMSYYAVWERGMRCFFADASNKDAMQFADNDTPEPQ